MHSEKSRQALFRMRDDCLRAFSWLGDMSVEAFENDLLTFYAVTRCLEIISEASRRLDPDLLDRYVEYDWRSMRAAGNVYRHDYDGVAQSIVYDTVRNRLPPLLVIVERELAALG